MVNLQKFSLRLIKSPLKRAQGNVSVIYMQGQTYLKSIMKCIHKCLFEVLFALIHLKKNAALPTTMCKHAIPGFLETEPKD